MKYRGTLSAAVFLALAVPANSATTVIDLKREPHTKIKGVWRVNSAGDVNGDGVPDVIVSQGNRGFEPTQGRSWVVFGDATVRVLDVDNLGDSGFLIEGAKEDDLAVEVDGAGDVNGDGLDDLIIGAAEADNNRRIDSGTAYIVFGKSDTDPVYLGDFDLGIQGSAGYRIDGPSGRAIAGTDVSGIGDMNRDGLDDVIVSAPFAGSSYVVFGKSDPFPIDLLTFDLDMQEDDGLRIDTPVPEIDGLYSVNGAGDVNNDGMLDVIIGRMRRIDARGSAHVIFGSDSTDPVDVRELGDRGFTIKGIYHRSTTGWAVAGAGDANGDGTDDVVVSAPAEYCCGYGAAYVVFGSSSTKTIRLRDLGKRGFKIRGANYNDGAGDSVDGVGDMDGDGLDDILVGAVGARYGDRDVAGSAYIVYGKKSTRMVWLSRLGNRGYRYVGPTRNYGLGGFAAGIGDMNGDGVPDLIAGTPVGATPPYGAHILWGRR